MLARGLFIAAALSVLVLCGCSSGYRAVYDIDLVGTERPESAQETFGEQVVKVVGEVGRERSHFEDGLVAIEWEPTPEEFRLQITNKSINPISIIWDDGGYVDENGQKHRIIHSKVIHEDREKSQKPTVVDPGGQVKEAVRSADNIVYEKGINARYREQPFFPESGSNPEELTQKTSPLVKKTVSVMLPLETSGEKYAYSFVFELANINIVKTKEDVKKESTWVEEDAHVPFDPNR
ncbi:MAG: hypothetical protein JSW50_04010 [Candidatus Latescibacterota bacterium]|nr:MAG: hypothetical protein JSW50_04010 [Candidatus Latescibacterota bacterium]